MMLLVIWLMSWRSWVIAKEYSTVEDMVYLVTTSA